MKSLLKNCRTYEELQLQLVLMNMKRALELGLITWFQYLEWCRNNLKGKTDE